MVREARLPFVPHATNALTYFERSFRPASKSIIFKITMRFDVLPSSIGSFKEPLPLMGFRVDHVLTMVKREEPPFGGSCLVPCFCLRNWSGRRDSNPRPQPWQGCALPLSYTRSSSKVRG